uniref:Tubulin polyglutamylase TTLL4 n=1 Tax=Haemonchus contortus TaxID=6289 RepID=A0A7I5EC14_HAECO
LEIPHFKRLLADLSSHWQLLLYAFPKKFQKFMHLLASHSLQSIFSLACIVLLSYNIYEVSQLAERLQYLVIADDKQPNTPTSRQPIAWIEGGGPKSLTTHLRHVVDLFQTLGYNVTSGTVPVEWDVLWTHGYSLMDDRYTDSIRKAKQHQIVNHVAGSGFYTSKVWLATSVPMKGIPQSYKLPKQKKEFLAYANQHPHISWVQKGNAHRDIEVRELKAMNLDKEDSFVQKFISNPLLIDNRFCAEDYLPFDSSKLDKYVVGDDYTPIWEIPSLKHSFTEQKLGWRASLDAYLLSKGMEPTKIWTQIHHIIAEVFRNQQSRMLAAFKSVPSKASFFELSRFDFIVDEDLNVFLMEANMSPNLSSEHFSQNRILYEQVLYNVFSLVGIASTKFQGAHLAMLDEEPSRDFIVPDSEIYVPLTDCIEGSCMECNKPICQLCAQCMSSTMFSTLKQTCLEHVNRRSMKMLQMNYDKQNPPPMEDNLLQIWRTAKCEVNTSWC